MSDFATPVSRLIDELKHLPGIGQKTAQRLAFYLLRAEKGPNGMVMKVEGTIFKNHKDSYYQECKMK